MLGTLVEHDIDTILIYHPIRAMVHMARKVNFADEAQTGGCG
jgi:hypothetical protein